MMKISRFSVKKALSTFLVFSIIMASFQVLVCAELLGANLIHGGDFEGTTIEFAGNSNQNMTLVSSPVHSGNGALFVQRPNQSGPFDGPKQTISVVAGKTYSVSAYFKMDYSNGSDNDDRQLAFNMVRSGDDVRWSGAKSWRTDTQFTYGEIKYTPNFTGEVTVTITVVGECNFYLDDIVIKEYDPLKINQVRNSDIESGTKYDVDYFKGSWANVFRITDPALVCNGSASLKVEPTADYGAVDFEGISVKAGKKYFVGAKVKLLPRGEAVMDSNVAVNLKYDGADHVFAAGPPQSSCDESYTEVKAIYTASEDKGCTLSFFVYPNGGAIQFIIDDVVFMEVEEPRVVSSSPANNADVYTNANVTLAFNNDMDLLSIADYNNYTLNGESANIKSITMPTSKSCNITFNSLEEEMPYIFSANNLKDIYGMEIENDFVINFTTRPASKPIIVSTVPANNGYHISLTTPITATFDIPVIESSLSTRGNVLINGSADMVQNVSYNADTNTATVSLNDSLQASTLYTVTFKNILSEQGVSIDQTSIQFYTVLLGANIIYENHFDTAADLATIERSNDGEGTQVTYFIDESVKFAGEGSLKISATNGYGGIKISSIPFENGKTYQISFKVMAAVGSPYVETAAAYLQSSNVWRGIAGIQSTSSFITQSFYYKVDDIDNISYIYFYGGSGNSYYMDEFRVVEVADTYLLPVKSGTNNQINVSTKEPLELIFNNPINLSSLSGNIKLDGSTALIGEISAIDGDLSRIQVNLAQSLQYNKKYTLTIENAKDTFEKTITNISVSFTTTQRYVLQDFGIYKDYGTANVKNLTNANLENGTLTAVVSRVLNYDVQGEFVIVFALYKDDSLVAVDYAQKTIPQNGIISIPIKATLNVSNIESGNYYVKAFAWEGFDSLRTITNSIKITK